MRAEVLDAGGVGWVNSGAVVGWSGAHAARIMTKGEMTSDARRNTLGDMVGSGDVYWRVRILEGERSCYRTRQ